MARPDPRPFVLVARETTHYHRLVPRVLRRSERHLLVPRRFRRSMTIYEMVDVPHTAKEVNTHDR